MFSTLVETQKKPKTFVAYIISTIEKNILTVDRFTIGMQLDFFFF